MKGLFASLLGVSAAAPAGPVPPPDDDRWYGGGPGAMSFAGRHVSADVSMRLSTVYACVNLLAKTVASLPLGIYRTDRDGSVNEAREHPLTEVLERRPNSWQTAFDFRAMMMSRFGR